MPDDTTILSLPLILPAQAQKHVTHNEALVALDVIVQLAVINRTLTAPPALPSVGDRHIVAAGATGDWAGQAGRIALYAATGWQFTAPLAGWRAHVLAEGATAAFDGLVWKTLSESPLTVPELGVASTADAVNRLTVSSPATLLNHAGGGHQLKLNKASPGDTASLLFQTGFSGRAEMGTAGTDDFSVKVSADGAVWTTALQAGAATGAVTLPQPLHLGGQAADPVAPPNGTLWLNTTTGEVKVRSGGLTLPVAAGGGAGVSDGDKGDITVSGGGAAWSIDSGAVGLAQMADLANGTIIGRVAPGTGAPEALTGAQATSLLDVFTDGAKGMVPASGGGTANFLRADGVFAPVSGGGTPAGTDGALQVRSGSGFAALENARAEGSELRLPAIATPAAPASGGVKLFGSALLGCEKPAFLGPNGRLRVLQSLLSDFNAFFYFPAAGGAGGVLNLPVSFTGTGAAGTIAVTNLHNMQARVEATAAASASAVCGVRTGFNFLRAGADANGPGGFRAAMLWGPATGVTNASHRAFCGLLSATGAPTDVNPSTLTNIIGMGYDAADTNIQIMHNDGSGAATKVNLGASFPKPSADRTGVYELQLFSPNSLTQSVSYRVIRYDTTGKTIAAETSGTITTDLPAVTQLLGMRTALSAGGVSSVVGVSVFGYLAETEY